MTTMLFTLLAAATIPLRNPFWPVGYAGEREAITDEPKIVIKPAPETPSEEDTKTSVNAETVAAAAAAAEEAKAVNSADRHWIDARKSLKFGGTMRIAGGRQSVSINGNIYADGDLISINHGHRRYTWRVRTLTQNGRLKLERVKCRELENAADDEADVLEGMKP